jgi:chemotaxis protein MotB
MITSKFTVLSAVLTLSLTAAAVTGWTAYYLELTAARQQYQQAEAAKTKLADRIATLQADGKALRQQYHSLRRQHRALQARQQQVEDSLANAIAERDDLNLRVDEARSEHSRLAGELDAILSERRQLNAQLDAARKVQDKLRAEFAANEKQARAKENALEVSQQRAQQLRDARDRLQIHLKIAADRQADLRKRLESTNERIAVKEADLEDSQRRIEALVTALDTANARILQLSAELSREKQARQRESEHFARLKTDLETELQSQEVEIEQLKNNLTAIRMGGDILFNVGSAELRPAGMRALRLIAAALEEYPERDISVEGHTDNLPIGEPLNAIYPSNWELSAARAARAARFLQTEAGIDPRRLRVVGYGEHQPVASNALADEMARNRRIEILLLPRRDRLTVKRAQAPGSYAPEQAVVDETGTKPTQAPRSTD